MNNLERFYIKPAFFSFIQVGAFIRDDIFTNLQAGASYFPQLKIVFADESDFWVLFICI